MTPTFRRLLLLLALALPLLFVLGCEQPATTGTPKPPAAGTSAAPSGQAAQDFTLTTLDGNKIALADLKGKPVLVNFWASWCHFCAQEAPDIEALYKQYHSQGLEVLGVGTDDPAALAKKAAELKITYPVGSDPDAARKYGVTGFPTTVVINRQGEVVASLRGLRTKSELESEIKKVM